MPERRRARRKVDPTQAKAIKKRRDAANRMAIDRVALLNKLSISALEGAVKKFTAAEVGELAREIRDNSRRISANKGHNTEKLMQNLIGIQMRKSMAERRKK